MRTTYGPGEAWELANQALKRGDWEAATELLPHMVESDAFLMTQKICKAQDEHAKPAPEPAAPSSIERTHPDGLWMVYYEDAEKKPDIFFGPGAESAARKQYADRKISWSCHLLSRIPDWTRPPHAEAADAGAQPSAIAATGNYVCDRDTDPTEVTFANGRTVKLVGEGHLVIGWKE